MKRHPADAAAFYEQMAILCALHFGPAPLLAEGLKAGHFESHERGQIYSGICADAAQRTDGKPDCNAVLAMIAAQPTDEMRAMHAELATSMIPDPAHAADYARGVLAGHARRECVLALREAETCLLDGTDPAAALARLQKYSPIVSGTARRGPDWNTAFRDCIQNGSAFMGQNVPERPALLHSFFKEGDTGLIFAARGVGKTWVSLLIAKAVAEGAALGEWSAGNAGPRRVCYVDGEVNLPDSIERARLLKLPPNVHWLHHEAISAMMGRPLNLAAPEQQRALLEMLLANGIAVLFLDNLSCLMRGVAENEADAWEKVLDWLLELRRAGISVVLIHHAGRNGELRGTSRREDAAQWILKLEDAAQADSKGAVFKSTFTKNRNAREGAASCPPLLWTLETESGPEGESLTVQCERHSDVDALVELVKNGLTSARDIAAELDVTPGTVSKWAKKAEATGRIRIEGRQYLPAA